MSPKTAVQIQLVESDLQRLDRATAARPYNRTRASFVLEIVLRELDRLDQLDRQQNGLPETAAAAPVQSPPARPAAGRRPTRRAGR